jgi:hypothetical protein
MIQKRLWRETIWKRNLPNIDAVRTGARYLEENDDERERHMH